MSRRHVQVAEQGCSHRACRMEGHPDLHAPSDRGAPYAAHMARDLAFNVFASLSYFNVILLQLIGLSFLNETLQGFE